MHNGGMDQKTVVGLLARACEQAGSQRAWARDHDVTGQYVHDVLKGRRAPGQAIIAALGLRRVVSYERVRG